MVRVTVLPADSPLHECWVSAGLAASNSPLSHSPLHGCWVSAELAASNSLLPYLHWNSFAAVVVVWEERGVREVDNLADVGVLSYASSLCNCNTRLVFP